MLWREEEFRIAAEIEGRLRIEHGDGVRLPRVNERIRDAMPYREVESIKSMRKVNNNYRGILAEAIAALRQAEAAEDTESLEEEADESLYESAEETVEEAVDSIGDRGANGRGSSPAPEPSDDIQPEHRQVHGEEEIRRLLGVTTKMDSPIVAQLNIIAQDFLDGRDVETPICDWMASIQASVETAPRNRRPRKHAQRRRRRRDQEPRGTPSRKKLRRREYAKLQTLWEKDLSKAAKLVLDGEMKATPPSMADMLQHWRPVLERPSPGVEETAAPENPDFGFVGAPITIREVEKVKIPTTSAPGRDKITFATWRQVPSAARALFFNIVLARGGFPSSLLVSRTVFVPKKDGSNLPSDFRPLSIAAVAVRQLHRIIALRLVRTDIIDKRQRGLVDGCAENITVLSALIADAKARLRELHILVTDIAKAFDSVSHHAIEAALLLYGLPRVIVDYIMRVYRESKTIIECGDEESPLISVMSGVRQGDPMSSWIFALIMSLIIGKVPNYIGYELEGEIVSELLYADDEVKVASTRAGMQTSLLATEGEAWRNGLRYKSSKCFALSYIPVGKEKKMRIATEPTFHLSDGSVVRQLGPSELFTFLGVKFTSSGVEKPSRLLDEGLARITKAPLKPQQRLKILRCFLAPRFYHQLVLGKCTARILKAMDRQVYVAVRRWLRLPKDVPIAYFHTACRDGGLGIPSFHTTIPGLVYDRMTSLRSSDSSVTRAAFNSTWTQKKLQWATHILERFQPPLLEQDGRTCYWRDKLYASTDGRELRESCKSSVSTNWIDRGSHKIPGRDYVQYHHVHINGLPSRMRTTRGRRGEGVSVQCRAGCPMLETTAHAIQSCFRTQGGRIKRHNAVSNTIAAALKDRGWTVEKEPELDTTEGKRKPDIVAVRDDHLVVVDTQVVSGVPPLNTTYGEKAAKYSTLAMKTRLAERYRVLRQNIRVGACTISWRGVWASRSVELLKGMGLRTSELEGLTTRVLQGSSTNWTRWNSIPTNYDAFQRRRTGIG